MSHSMTSSQPAYHSLDSDGDFARVAESGLAMRPVFSDRGSSSSGLLQPPLDNASGGTKHAASELVMYPENIDGIPQSPITWQRRRRPKLWSITLHFTACIVVLGAFVGSVLGPLLLSGDYSEGLGLCDAGGNFLTDFKIPSFWSPSTAFQITLGFGSMSFRNAKLIDVAWDVVIGRGGQAILAFISYQVFTKCLTRLMERTSITLEVFESLTLRDPLSPTAIWVLMKDFWKNDTVRAKLSFFWITIASLYAISFQTLMSAMTGYSSITSPYVKIPPDGNLVPWSSLSSVAYVVHDAWRIGLTGNFISIDITDSDGSSCSGYIYDYSPDSKYPEKCLLLLNIYNYTQHFGLNGAIEQKTSSFPNPKDSSSIIHLPPPTLNISSFQFEYWESTNIQSENIAFALSDQSDNRTYALTYIEQNGLCSPEKLYQWGFSGLLLFFAIVLTTVWLIGMWIMWLDAYYQSNLDLYGRQLGNFRAALDLAEVLRVGLGERDETNRLSDKAIRKRIKSVQFNATISYANIRSRNTTSNRSADLGGWLNRRGWGRWVMRHKIWTWVLAISLGITLIMLLLFHRVLFH